MDGNMIRIQSTINRKNICQLCLLLKEHGLYQSRDWMMIEFYEHPNVVECLSWAVDLEIGQPIGAGVLISGYSTDVSCYILPSYRRRGIGTQLVKRAYKRKPHCRRNCGQGIRGSDKFFEQVFRKHKFTEVY